MNSMKKSLFFTLIIFTTQMTLTMNRSQPVQIVSSSPTWGNSEQFRPSSPNWGSCSSSPEEQVVTKISSPAEKLLVSLQEKLNSISDQRRSKLSQQLRDAPKRDRGRREDELFEPLLKEFNVTEEQRELIGGFTLTSLRHQFFNDLLNTQ